MGLLIITLFVRVLEEELETARGIFFAKNKEGGRFSKPIPNPRE